ncbi:rRNA maturation RNase YbeY [Vannielia litorea]|uniref:Endoribonuclease YbeY n=1 Tax=Vannielia litorea TaxID=1217970 RepID=A0A1N6GLT2_9RHOB|nr:rRNA maturation RNase YbeY [Vannielia litorea]SIO08464.1 probable rRNA maturation factor [Vannielia litorea]
MELDVVLEDARWDAAGLETVVALAAPAVLAFHGLPEQVELSVLGADDARVAALNGDFRGKPQPTNVLSWPSQDLAPERPGGDPLTPEPDPDGTLPLGDIALAYETCAREANEGGLNLRDHLTHLVVHGMMHLLGYDHINDADAELMEAREAEILAKLGVKNPYE